MRAGVPRPSMPTFECRALAVRVTPARRPPRAVRVRGRVAARGSSRGEGPRATPRVAAPEQGRRESNEEKELTTSPGPVRVLGRTRRAHLLEGELVERANWQSREERPCAGEESSQPGTLRGSGAQTEVSLGPGTGPSPAAKNSYDHCPASAHILTRRAAKRSPHRRRVSLPRSPKQQRFRPFHALWGGPEPDHERLGRRYPGP